MPLPADLPQQLHALAHGYTNAIWDYRPKPGHLIEHLTDPDYWVHVLQDGRVRVHDRIDAIAQDGSYFVQMLITEIDERRQWAKTFNMYRHWDKGQSGTAPAAVDADGYKIEFSGPQKWRIINTMVNKVIAKGFETEDDAKAALANLKTAKAA